MEELGVQRLDEMIGQMREEIAKLGRQQLQRGLTYDQVVWLFIEQTSGGR